MHVYHTVPTLGPRSHQNHTSTYQESDLNHELRDSELWQVFGRSSGAGGGERGLRLSPSPCKTIYDVWSSNVQTVVRRNVNGTWNFVKNMKKSQNQEIFSTCTSNCQTGKGNGCFKYGGKTRVSSKTDDEELEIGSIPQDLMTHFWH